MRRALALSLFACVLAASALSARAQTGNPVSGVVFVDANGNGTRDANERGLADVVVSNQQQVVKTTADGTYRLPSAGFGVVFVSVPDGYAVRGSFWRAAANGTADFPLVSQTSRATFTFIHASDTHVSAQSLPRLQRLRAITEARKPDFVIVSGDLVRDALRVGEQEATGYYDIYTRETAQFPVPVWSVPGNHENFGIERHLSLVSAKHPLYGKGMYRARLGPNYYSFNYGSIHFVGLDSVDIEDLWYYGHIDAAQLAWLRDDLAALAPGTTVVTFNHIPFVSAVESANGYRDDGPAPSTIRIGGRTVYRHIVSNFAEVLPVLKPFDWTLALGGHLHTRETIRFESPTRTRFYQTAAVVGPTEGPVPAISGVTLYRVSGRTIDEGTFIPLEP
jgi:predicted MPP superfamily phosphohydrolase